MRTVAETRVFIRYAASIWSDGEREEFIDWIATNPESGRLIPGSGGCRKVRWQAPGRGKRGGVRVIDALAPDGTVWLLILYAKGELENIPGHVLEQMRKGIADAL